MAPQCSELQSTVMLNKKKDHKPLSLCQQPVSLAKHKDRNWCETSCLKLRKDMLRFNSWLPAEVFFHFLTLCFNCG